MGSLEGLLAPPVAAMDGAEFCLKLDLWTLLLLAPNLELAVTGVAAEEVEEPLYAARDGVGRFEALLRMLPV